MCKETNTANSSTQPATLMFHEYRQPFNIARHTQVSLLTCGLAGPFLKVIAVVTAGD